MRVEEGLRHALAEATEGRVTFARDFQGFPGTVHGGAVAALLYRVTTPRPPAQTDGSAARRPDGDAPPAHDRQRRRGRRLGLPHGERQLAEAELARIEPPPVDGAPLLAAWRARVGDEEVARGRPPAWRAGPRTHSVWS